MATMTRAATNIQHFVRSVAHMYDEKGALAAWTVQGFFLLVAAQKKAALRAATRLLAFRREVMG